MANTMIISGKNAPFKIDYVYHDNFQSGWYTISIKSFKLNILVKCYAPVEIHRIQFSHNLFIV